MPRSSKLGKIFGDRGAYNEVTKQYKGFRGGLQIFRFPGIQGNELVKIELRNISFNVTS